MLLLDSIVESGDTHAVTERTFQPGDYGVAGGFVSEAALIECMAQTLAAYQGHYALTRNIPPQPGLLVGIRDARIDAAVLPGDALRIRIEITHRVGDFVVATGRVDRADETVARATLKVYVPGLAR